MAKNGCWGTTGINAGEAHPGGWDNGDCVAQMLRGRSREECLEETAENVGIPLAELTKRYAHLNNGMVRAICGNILRDYLRREGVPV